MPVMPRTSKRRRPWPATCIHFFEPASNPTLILMTSFPWQTAGKFSDILYEKWDGIAKITINRPEVRNAFRPQTLFDMQTAFLDAREDPQTSA